MSDVPTDPAPTDDESALGLGWLFDAPEPDEEDGNSAIWPTEAVDMLPLPGFTLDEDSVLVPLTSAADVQGLEVESPNGGPSASRARGQRIRVALRSRAGAGAGVLGSLILVAAAVAMGIGLPSGGGTDGGRPAASSAAEGPSAPVVDTSWTADLEHAVKVAQRRQQLLDAAERRSAARRAEAREKRQKAAARTYSPAPTPVSSPAVQTASPPSDPWASVPGPVREFEPGPWNNGGATS